MIQRSDKRDCSTSCAELRMLNLGCGSTFHPDWVNIDAHDHGGAVISYDLRLGIPFADNSFDIVYHSHVLEHFTRDMGKHFLEECLRVLRPGGFLRVVVPDLENITSAYIEALNRARSGDEAGKEQHEWMMIELLDQMVRQKSGGEMLDYWKRNPMPQEQFVFERSGQEAVAAIENIRRQNKTQQLTLSNSHPLPLPDFSFIDGGELHRWMYDEFSLTALLQGLGFEDVTKQSYDQSFCMEMLDYGLDSAPNESIRKPDSLFIEAKKVNSSDIKTPKVAMFASTESGGAGIATLRLHQGLQDIGHYGHMYVAEQKCSAPRLHVFPAPGQNIQQTQHGDAVLPSLLNSRKNIRNSVARYPNRPAGLEYFSAPEQSISLNYLPFFEDFDILHLHWIAGMLDPSLCKDELKKRPVVWTLHDMNAFTGGCHYANGCTKFIDYCHACPQLGSSDDKDLSFQTWSARKAAYRELDLHIVCPSKWLAEEAKKSNLLKKFPIHVIANAHPVSIFHPMRRELLRKDLGIDKEDFVLIFASQDLTNIRKGTKYLIESLKLLAKSELVSKVHLLFLGKNPPDVFSELGFKISSVGHVDDANYMAVLYNVADAVIVPSLEDNAPNVICEAACCGTPVVAFSVGGISEMIEHERSGWLTTVQDVQGLFEGIVWAYENKDNPKTRLSCRAFALEKWNVAARSAEYAQLYANIVAQNRNAQRKDVKANSIGALPEEIPSALCPGANADLISVLDSKNLIDAYRNGLGIDITSCLSGIPHIGLYSCRKSGLKQYYPPVIGDGDFYAKLQKFDWYYLKDKAEYSIAEKYISPESSVLEIGCGEAFFAELCDIKNYTGLEFNKSAVACACEKGFNVKLEDLESYAATNVQQHDIVCIFQVLEHIAEPYSFIENCLKCLKPGGRLICSVPSEDAFVGKIINDILNMPPHHATKWSDKALLSIQDIFGLESAEIIHCKIENIHANHYINSMSNYYAAKQLGYSKILVSADEFRKIKQKAIAFLPVTAQYLSRVWNKIYGHDVVAIFRK